ncbi:MAG: hypothetical protein LBV56_06860 [Delftia acidovorans]|nr:hypothetical protein [Delftia acidovorans]
MARTPKTTMASADTPRLNEAALSTLDAAPTQLAVAHETMDEVLAAGIDLGRLEALTFIQTVSESAALSIYENVKKSKAWRHLRNPNSSNGLNFSSLDEFCQAKLGRGYARMQMLAGNQRLIGQEAFEQAERLGLHQRDYNAIKALPAPDQELVRRAVEEAQSRDEVIDLLQELAVRHAQEKEAMGKELQDAHDQAAELAASKKVVEGTVADLRKQARRLAQATPDDLAAHLRTQAQDIAQTIEAEILGPLCQGLEQVIAHGEQSGHSQSAWVKGQLELIRERLATVAGRLGTELQAKSEMPAWLDTSAISGMPSSGSAQAAS